MQILDLELILDRKNETNRRGDEVVKPRFSAETRHQNLEILESEELKIWRPQNLETLRSRRPQNQETSESGDLKIWRSQNLETSEPWNPRILWEA